MTIQKGPLDMHCRDPSWQWNVKPLVLVKPLLPSLLNFWEGKHKFKDQTHVWSSECAWLLDLMTPNLITVRKKLR